MKGKEVVILNEANILEARDILSEKRGYIDENGNIWTYRDLCDAIYNSSVGYEDFYGEWIEVEERYFYEVQEMDASLDCCGNLVGSHDICLTSADSEEDAEGIAYEKWSRLSCKGKARTVVTAYKAKGYTYDSAMESCRYENICSWFMFNDREYCLRSMDMDSVVHIDSEIDEFIASYDSDWDSDPNAIDDETYSLDLDSYESDAEFEIDRTYFDKHGKIKIKGCITVGNKREYYFR